MSDTNIRPVAGIPDDEPDSAEAGRTPRPQAGDHEQGGLTDELDRPLNDNATESRTEVGASNTMNLDPLAFPPQEVERFQRLVSAPWIGTSAAANFPHLKLAKSFGVLANLNLTSTSVSPRSVEAIGRIFKGAIPDMLPINTIFSDALRPLSQMQLLPDGSFKNLSDAIVQSIGASLRHAMSADYAKTTQTWLTTTESLRYKGNRFVWHYTNGHACMSIIRNGTLWASSPESLNDRSEIRHGLLFIQNALDEEMNRPTKQQPFDHSELHSIDTLMKAVLDEASIDSIISEVYIVSASSQEDSLTLWRNYANGDGFALGLSTRPELAAEGVVLEDETHLEHLRNDVPAINGWYRVTYAKNQKEKLATEFIQSAIEDIRRTEPHDRERLASELRKQAVILASVMKHDAFSDEKEVRWISTTFTSLDPVHYEHGRRSIVPVLHVRASSKDKDALLPLRGVRCSPIAPAGIVRTMQGFLKQMGYADASSNVKQSDQPFKG